MVSGQFPENLNTFQGASEQTRRTDVVCALLCNPPPRADFCCHAMVVVPSTRETAGQPPRLEESKLLRKPYIIAGRMIVYSSFVCCREPNSPT